MLILVLLLAGVFIAAAWALYRRADVHKVAMEALERRIALRNGAAIAAPRHVRPFSVPARIEPVLARAQIEPTPQLLGTLLAIAGMVFCVALFWLGFLIALGVVVLLAAGGAAFVRARARRNTEAFIDALPIFLDNVRQLLAVGNSLSQALLRGVAVAPAPVQAYLGAAARRIELGAPLGDSIQHVADRLAIPELAMLAAAVRSNLRFGGPMTGIIGNLVNLIRERLRIKRELASATAEMRISTRLMIAMPLLLIAFLLFTNPTYRTFFFDDPRGHRLAMIAAVAQGLGIIMMIRIQRLVF